MHRGGLRVGWRPAGRQDTGHAAHKRGTALEDVTSGYPCHAFLPREALGQLDAAWDPLSDFVPPWFNARARSCVRNTLLRQSFLVFADLQRRCQFWRETWWILRREGPAADACTIPP